MRAHFGLPSVEAEDKEGKPPISVKFEIPYFTTSGIQVRERLQVFFLFLQIIINNCISTRFLNPAQFWKDSVALNTILNRKFQLFQILHFLIPKYQTMYVNWLKVIFKMVKAAGI